MGKVHTAHRSTGPRGVAGWLARTLWGSGADSPQTYQAASHGQSRGEPTASSSPAQPRGSQGMWGAPHKALAPTAHPQPPASTAETWESGGRREEGGRARPRAERIPQGKEGFDLPISVPRALSSGIPVTDSQERNVPRCIQFKRRRNTSTGERAASGWQKFPVSKNLK